MRTKFRLFPENQRLVVLIWLFFLLIPLIGMYPYDSLKKIMLSCLIMVFALCYRNSLFEEKYYLLWIVIQYCISFFYLMYLGYVYLFMFPAWKIGFSKLSKKEFLGYYLSLFVLIIFGSFIGWRQGTLLLERSNLILSSLFGLFILVAPFSGREFLKQQEQRKQIYQANKRLESVIVGEERNRIARELHDSLGQSLSAISIKLDLIQKLFDRDLDLAKEETKDTQNISRETLATVREIVSDMRRKSIIEELVEANRLFETAKIILITENEECLQKIPMILQNKLGDCIREATTNIVRHSQATFCKILFEIEYDQLKILIKDNGVGIQNHKYRNGLSGMRERVEQLKGTLLIKSNKGTIITISVPLEAKND